LAHKALLTPDSVALSQAPAKAATQWTWGQCVARCACLLPAYAGTKLYRGNVSEQLATAQRLELNLQSPIASPTPLYWFTLIYPSLINLPYLLIRQNHEERICSHNKKSTFLLLF